MCIVLRGDAGIKGGMRGRGWEPVWVRCDCISVHPGEFEGYRDFADCFVVMGVCWGEYVRVGQGLAESYGRENRVVVG